MYCRYCGAPNDDNANFCSVCGKPLKETTPGQPELSSSSTPSQANPPVQQNNMPQPSPESPPDNMQTPPRPSSYLIPAILVTLFCCLPGGIVSLYYASQVNFLYEAGEIQKALDASRKAKIWTLLSAGFGFFLVLLYAMFIFLSAVTTSTHHY